MHELSLAQAMVEVVRQQAPAGCRIRSVLLRAGPMRGIEPDAMLWAWQAATDASELQGAKLELEILPWTLRCPDCQRTFSGASLFEPCACGGERTYPVGGAELQVMSMDIDDAAPAAAESNMEASLCKCP